MGVNDRPRANATYGRWGLAWLLFLTVVGCTAPADPQAPENQPPATEPADTEPPPPPNPTPPPEPPPSVEPTPKPTPKPKPKPNLRALAAEPLRGLEITGTPGHTVVTAPRSFEGFTLTPDGLAFAYWDDVWLLSARTQALTHIEAELDPHALVTDGEYLYWIGDEVNEKLNLATLKKSRFPRFGGPFGQRSLAMGDTLYGLATQGRVYAFRGNKVGLVADEDRTIQEFPYFQAADGIVVLFVMDLIEMEPILIRHRVRREELQIELGPKSTEWSLDDRGTLIFVRDGQVMQLRRNFNKPRPLFERGDLKALCWCGRDICGVSEDGELRVHRRGKAESRAIGHITRPINRLRCNEKRMAWATFESDVGENELHLLSLRAARSQRAQP